MSSARRPTPEDRIPDARDGLTRIERLILVELERAQRESGSSRVATAMLYGRVIEHVLLSVPEFQRTLRRLVRNGENIPR